MPAQCCAGCSAIFAHRRPKPTKFHRAPGLSTIRWTSWVNLHEHENIADRRPDANAGGRMPRFEELSIHIGRDILLAIWGGIGAQELRVEHICRATSRSTIRT